MCFCQKNPFACENWYRIYTEKDCAQNLIYTKKKKKKFVKNKGKKGFQNQQFLCKFIHLSTVGCIILPVQQQKHKTRIHKSNVFSAFFILFSLK